MSLAPQCDMVLVVGSQNSSNSLRLVEIAKNRGVKAYLVDDVSEIDHSWMQGVNTVLLTAGASAPEDLVQAIIAEFKKHYGATVEDVHISEENVHFELPLSLRRLEQQPGQQPTRLTISARS